jgi:hypothetical protein
MGFPVESTFAMLCPDGKFDCEKGSVWKIVYPEPKIERKESHLLSKRDIHDGRCDGEL